MIELLNYQYVEDGMISNGINFLNDVFAKLHQDIKSPIAILIWLLGNILCDLDPKSLKWHSELAAIAMVISIFLLFFNSPYRKSGPQFFMLLSCTLVYEAISSGVRTFRPRKSKEAATANEQTALFIDTRKESFAIYTKNMLFGRESTEDECLSINPNQSTLFSGESSIGSPLYTSSPISSPYLTPVDCKSSENSPRIYTFSSMKRPNKKSMILRSESILVVCNQDNRDMEYIKLTPRD